MIYTQLTGWADYFPLLISFEGTAYEDVPGDDGGPTKYGIDAASHPGVDIRNLTLTQADFLHFADFGKTYSGRLPAPLNFAFFDFAMNGGDGSAVRALQTVIGVTVDGGWGPITDAALWKWLAVNGPGAFLSRFNLARLSYYHGLVAARPVKQKFLNGWVDRCEQLLHWAAPRIVGNNGGTRA
jgi:lysozyme family protein